MNAQISIQVLALIASGMSGVDALRQVCGAEIVDQMIGELYEALRAKGQARQA
jgi:hypothetical protein